MRFFNSLIAVSVLFVLSLTTASAQYYVQLPLVSGPNDGVAQGVGNGVVVGTHFTNTSQMGLAARFSETQPVFSFGTLGGAFSSARAVSPNGLYIVGDSGNGDGFDQGFFWDGSMHSLPGLGYGVTSTALDVNNQGQAVGNSQDPTTFVLRAVTYLSGSHVIRQLPTFSGDASATTITSSTTDTPVVKIGGWSARPDGRMEGAIWTPSGSTYTIVGVGTLPFGSYRQSWVSDMTNDGWATGTSSFITSTESVFRGYVWRQGVGMTDLGGTNFVEPYAIRSTASGLLVGGRALFNTPNGPSVRAFIWSPSTGIVDLNTLVAPEQGWTLYAVTAIDSVNGQMVGYKINSAGETKPFLVSPNVSACAPVALQASNITRWPR